MTQATLKRTRCQECGRRMLADYLDEFPVCPDCIDAKSAEILAELHAERDWLDACARARAEREARPVEPADDGTLNDGTPF